jgi:hypothetical protein
LTGSTDLDQETVVQQRDCDVCGRSYEAVRVTSRYCGPTCRQRSLRAAAAGLALPTATLDGHEAPSDLELATARELEAAGRLQSVAGQAALVLAYRIGSRRETGSATAALAKQLHLTMTWALGGVAVAADPLDEIRARRDLKRSAGRL